LIDNEPGGNPGLVVFSLPKSSGEISRRPATAWEWTRNRPVSLATKEGFMTAQLSEPEAPAQGGGTGGGTVTPIVVDLGKKRKSLLRKLKRGRGRLMDDVLAVVEQAREAMGESGDGQVLVPVVMICRRRRKKSKQGLFGF
jgi:hypothetical protein